MKYNTKKSSVTLPPRELKMVKDLMKFLGAKSKVEIIRQGLYLLQARTFRERLKQAYAQASKASRASLEAELKELDHLSGEGLDDE